LHISTLPFTRTRAWGCCGSSCCCSREERGRCAAPRATINKLSSLWRQDDCRPVDRDSAARCQCLSINDKRRASTRRSSICSTSNCQQRWIGDHSLRSSCQRRSHPIDDQCSGTGSERDGSTRYDDAATGCEHRRSDLICRARSRQRPENTVANGQRGWCDVCCCSSCCC
jgi:hypothetical protein